MIGQMIRIGGLNSKPSLLKTQNVRWGSGMCYSMGKRRKHRRLAVAHERARLEHDRAFRAIGIKTQTTAPMVWNTVFGHKQKFLRKYPLFRKAKDRRLL